MLKWTESFMWNIEVKYFFDFEAYFDILDTFHIDCASFSKEIRENKWNSLDWEIQNSSHILQWESTFVNMKKQLK